MRNSSFFTHLKWIVGDKCNNSEEFKIEIQKEETKDENVKSNTEPKLNFQLFDIDRLFES